MSEVEDTCVQPGSEAFVRGHINEFPSTKNEVGLEIIEPCDTFIAKDSLKNVQLRFMNVSNVVKILRSDTNVGNISLFKKMISDNNNVTVQQKDRNLRIELQKILINCIENFSQEQKRRVEDLLSEYKDLFPASDRDLGRTT